MKKLSSILIMLILIATQALPNTATLLLERGNLQIEDTGMATIKYNGFQQIAIGGSFSLPAGSLLLPLRDSESPEDIQIESLSPIDLGIVIPITSTLDGITAEDLVYTSLVDTKNGYNRIGSQPIEIVGDISINGIRYAEVLIFPVTIDSTGKLWFHESVQIAVANRPIASNELIPRAEVVQSKRRPSPSAASDGWQYLVITSETLAPAMQSLVTYKNETGFRTELRLIEDILIAHEGRDDAERLRNHLKDFYAAGGQYVLLAGDETILPIRYAYPNSTRTLPALDYLQICDLYFADLTGDWDADGDSVWGEKYTDDVDLVPELLIGRLPINLPEEATNYIAKLIQYETDPGAGERSYLERAFFFSSDQMRDDGDNGQHGHIASAYPDWFEIDTISGVEMATGDDPAPTNLDPTEVASVLTQGFGITNIVAHGRSDGYVLKSSGYNDWPKTYLLTDNNGTEHGQFNSFLLDDKPGFYYSLACNNGGFDMDQPPFNQVNPNVAQELIGHRGGAVALVAYSRWGWISSSYLLQKSFFDSLFAYPERPAVEALYASKTVFYYYRDLVYGLNYFGDPTLKIYTSEPKKPEIQTSVSSEGLDVTITVDSNLAVGCNLILAENGTIIGEYVAGSDGCLTIDYPFDKSGEYKLSTLISEATVAQVDFIPALITGFDDEDDVLLPDQFELHQNYPNPFNPATTISFDLPEQSDVRLSVFNVLGQLVTTLADNQLSPGRHEFEWYGINQSGDNVASGIYFYRLETEAYSSVRKMILLK